MVSNALLKSNIAMSTRDEGREKATHGGQELCFTREACSETMVEMCQNVVFLKIGHEMEADDVLKKLTWDKHQPDGTVMMTSHMLGCCRDLGVEGRIHLLS